MCTCTCSCSLQQQLPDSPVVGAEPVERHVELHDVGGEEDVVADGEVAFGDEVRAQQAADEQPRRDDHVLRRVEQVQRRRGDPLRLL